MRIHFVVNTTGLTGGIRVVFEYANRLAARGHDVVIIYPYDLTGEKWPAKAGWVALAKRIKFTFVRGVVWFPLSVPILRIPRLEDRYMPDADRVIATANETADWVAKLSPSKGEKYYFIQHFEDWARDPELVKATWKLPLKKIVISSWMKKFAEDLGETVEATITNGVNLEEFYCKDRVTTPVPRLLMMTHNLVWKGTADGLQAIKLLRAQGKEFELTLFGAYKLEEELPAQTQFVDHPTGDAVRQLYCSHDIFISPSWKEGCQLPPMEAMACGCAVIATNVGGIPDYALAGETALVVEPQQPEELAKAIGQLLDDQQLREKVAAAGHAHIQQYTWGHATDQFETALHAA